MLQFCLEGIESFETEILMYASEHEAVDRRNASLRTSVEQVVSMVG